MKRCESEGPPTSGASRAKQLVLKYQLKIQQFTLYGTIYRFNSQRQAKGAAVQLKS